MGRLFALLIVAAGVLQTLTSLAFLALAAAARLGRPIELPEAVPAVDGGYLGAMLAGGIVLIVFGAVARAVFDGADALRHLTGRDGPR